MAAHDKVNECQKLKYAGVGEWPTFISCYMNLN